MREANPIAQLQRRLLELGCPIKVARKIVRETAEHYEDLQKTSLAQGLSPVEAATSATKLLGDPRELAERHLDALRNSSWLAKHPLLTFGLLPVGVLLGLAALFWSFGGATLLWGDPWYVLHVMYLSVPFWTECALCGGLLAVTTLTAFYLCRFAQRFAVARRWMWMAGAVLALHGLFVQIRPSGWFVRENRVDVVKEEKIAPGKSMLISQDYRGDGYAFLQDSALRAQVAKKLTKIWEDQLSNYLHRISSPHWAFLSDESHRVLKQNWGSKWQAISETRTGMLGVFAHGNDLEDPSLHAQITKSMTEIWAQLSDPLIAQRWKWGWVSPWQVVNERQPSVLDVTASSDGSGLLRWKVFVDTWVPLPSIFYSLSVGSGGWLYWFNVALPLLMVAAMLAWQRRGAKRLMREEQRLPLLA